jgi:hypothetical protein
MVAYQAETCYWIGAGIKYFIVFDWSLLSFCSEQKGTKRLKILDALCLSCHWK